MGLKVNSRSSLIPHIESDNRVVGFDRLYWFVNILIVDEILQIQKFHRHLLKVTFSFRLVHARLPILEILSLTFIELYSQIL